MKKNYDIVIIGAGVAGNSAALEFVKAGKKVAVIENDQWGGTCPNRGCDPKKILLSAVEARNHASQMTGKGIKEAPVINWPDLIAYKNTYTDPVSESTKSNLQNSGVDVFQARGEFIDGKTVKVNDHLLEAEKIIIATGARPSILAIEGKEYLLTSRDFLDLPKMPDTVTFIGGGYIGFEFAAIANAAGAKVHLIHHNSRPLKAYDKELVEDLMTQLKEDGIEIHLDIDIRQIEENSNGFLLTDHEDFELKSDLVFGSTGRLPNIESLNLEKADIDSEKNGILVNDYLQTNNPSIYAMGDVLAKKQPKLTSIAGLESSYLVSLLTNKVDSPIIYPVMPSVVFSGPKMAQVGIRAIKAENNPNQYDLSTIDATNWFSYFRSNEGISKVKIVTDRESGLLVGASVLNNEAANLINLLSIFINEKMKADEISKIGWSYPTIASDLPYFYS